MDRDLKMRRTATAATILCVAVVAGSVLLVAVPEWRRALGIGAADQPAYAVGDRIDVPPKLYDSAPLTLLLFARSECSGCQSAKPAFAGLVSALREHDTVRVILTVAEGTEPGERQYLHDLGLDNSRLATLDFGRLVLRRVPAMVLVDRTGTVRYSLEGPPSVLDQAEILRIAASSNTVR